MKIVVGKYKYVYFLLSNLSTFQGRILFSYIFFIPSLLFKLLCMSRGFPASLTYLRWVYVCYATDLALGGERILKTVIFVAVAAFSLQWIIIYPIRGKNTILTVFYFFNT